MRILHSCTMTLNSTKSKFQKFKNRAVDFPTLMIERPFVDSESIEEAEEAEEEGKLHREASQMHS